MEFIDSLINFFSPGTRCDCEKECPDFCKPMGNLLRLSKTNKNFNKEKARRLYEGLLQIDSKVLNISEENNKQIVKDLARTYPTVKSFSNLQEKMSNVLKAFSNYDREIRYVQGMNFIVGFLLFHCEEYVAFWLFVSLIEEYQLRQVYIEGFPGLEFHCECLNKIIMRYYPQIKEAFDRLNINLMMVLIEWVCSLFSSTIPSNLQILFYEGFFIDGWNFFYKVCISVILYVLTYKEISKFNDAEEFYIELKFKKNSEKIWIKIINDAYNLTV